jgi:hypothetical protein
MLEQVSFAFGCSCRDQGPPLTFDGRGRGVVYASQSGRGRGVVYDNKVLNKYSSIICQCNF